MYIHLNADKQMTDFKLWLKHKNIWSHSTVLKQMINSK